jgi:recombination protein RecR
VVEEPGDVIPMERTHEYHGVYHVLGGALSPIDGIDPEDLKVAELYARVSAPLHPAQPAGQADTHDAAPAADAGASWPPPGAPGASDAAHLPPSTTPHSAVREVVLATNPTTTGEATALHIAAGLRERVPGLRVTRLASGLPVGADLEYADEVTLGKALAGRQVL